MCLGSLARVDYWETTYCPMCGMGWKDCYGHITPNHYEDCPVKIAQTILEGEGIFV